MTNNSPVLQGDLKYGPMEFGKLRNESMTCTHAAAANPQHSIFTESDERGLAKDDQQFLRD